MKGRHAVQQERERILNEITTKVTALRTARQSSCWADVPSLEAAIWTLRRRAVAEGCSPGAIRAALEAGEESTNSV